MKPSLQRLMGLYAARQGWLLLALVCLAVTWLAAVGLLALSGWFITACALAGVGALTGLNLFTPSAAIRGLALLRTVGRYAERVIGHEAILRVLADLRLQGFLAMARRAERRDVEHGMRHADRVTRLMADVDTLDAVPLRVLGPALAALLTAMVVLVVAAAVGGVTAFGVVAVSTVLILLVSVMSAKLGRSRGLAWVRARSQLKILVDDHVRGLAELHACGRQQDHAHGLLNADELANRRLAGQERIASIGEHLTQAVVTLAALAMLLQGWGQQDPAILVLLVLMTLGLNEALASLPGAFWRLGESEEAAQRWFDLDNASTDVQGDRVGLDARINPAWSRLVVTSLVCLHGGQRPLDFTLEAGMPGVLAARSGSGKTTLLRTLAGELPLRQGRVHLLGPERPAPVREHVRGRDCALAYLDQFDGLLDVSLREFLTLGLEGIQDEELWGVLETVELAEVFRQLDWTLDERLGPHGNRLSGGQARRLQLAGWLLRDPVLVLLDEPFRGLPSDQVQRIVARITPWLCGRCVLIVTHDPSLLPAAWPRLEGF